MFVWKAMPSITPMISEMRRELSVMAPIVCTTPFTVLPPCSATLLASSARTLAWLARSAFSVKPCTATRRVCAAVKRLVMSVAYFTTLKGRPSASRIGL
ncbi:hypothetical protein G6F22_021491 [Rhizopus arrhizus]|nr:hypothetical protein G6F22_021491 [Rhizopus arrhizus]